MNVHKFSKYSIGLVGLCVGVALSACAPKSVPRDASHEWDILNGSVWFWSDKLDTGCTFWMASERWLSVQLVTEPQCSTEDRHDGLSGKRVSFQDTPVFQEAGLVDYLKFIEYGPWSYEIRDKLTVYDADGNFIGFRPCPHDITPEDISKLKLLSDEASAVATTDGEKRLMDEMSVRFANVDLSALSSSQSGCTDKPLKRPIGPKAENLP